jgi:hypothetical protein
MDLRTALDEVEPLARGVHVVEAVVARWEDLHSLRANNRRCGEVACPPAVGFDETKDDATCC